MTCFVIKQITHSIILLSMSHKAALGHIVDSKNIDKSLRTSYISDVFISVTFSPYKFKLGKV